MASSDHTRRIGHGKLGLGLFPSLVQLALEGEDESFLDSAMKTISDELKASSVSLMQGVKGQWRTLASTGKSKQAQPPMELLSETLDAESTCTAGTWSAVPLNRPNRAGEVLAIDSPKPISEEELDSVTAALDLANIGHQARIKTARRSAQLEAILEVTALWNQSRQTDELLMQIAEASTRLLGAERATIFLPDASGESLIGKPALGVEDGMLRIPAGAGVVGKVMESGQPIRVDEDISDEQQQINREVDEKLGFQTTTLLCVPMINSQQQTIGAFEVINRLTGNFTQVDQDALVELAHHASVAIENTQHVEHLVTTQTKVADEAAGDVALIGQCPEIEKLKQTIGRVADTELSILITGENGTGKEVVAQLVHYLSSRRGEVMVTVNCAAISETLLESELFGHEKGAFTDAHQAREGKFELADGGTLFLDEIGDMSLGGQAKLLRVLEEKVVVRVGGSANIPTSARVVAATNQNLGELVRDKKFREDLFFRLNVVTIELPPLRTRGDDVILLAEHFLNGFCKKARREPPKISASVKKRLLGHRWPGNVRELRNMMERIAYLSEGDNVSVEDLAFVDAPAPKDSAIELNLTLSDATQQFQLGYIQRQIDSTNGNMTDAAANMGLHRSNLYRKMKQLGMSAEDG